MFQFHTPGSKALPFTFLAYGSCTLKKKKNQEFIACMLLYSKPNQTWWNELKHFEVVVRKGPFWVLFPGRAADEAEDLCVFWDPQQRMARHWWFTFLSGTALDWAAFGHLLFSETCAFPIPGCFSRLLPPALPVAAFLGLNVVMPKNFGDLRSVESPHGSSSVTPGRGIFAPLPSCYL